MPFVRLTNKTVSVSLRAVARALTVRVGVRRRADVCANERLVEQLKAALGEQESTMQTQDTVLRGREDEVATLNKGHRPYPPRRSVVNDSIV